MSRGDDVEVSEIFISVYDLLPPGRLASALWLVGTSLLHTGVHIKALGREYAFGGHCRPGISGVYWTRPHTEPPGGTFRCERLHGVCRMSRQELESEIKHISELFLGPGYNLLSRNCNHFTSTVCERLTGRPAPDWINRAARVGLALPCMVPQDWIEPPEAEGNLVGTESADAPDEDSHMLQIQKPSGSALDEEDFD